MNKLSNSFTFLLSFSFSVLFANHCFAQHLFVKCIGSVRSDFGVACQPTFDKGTILLSETSTNGMDVHCGITKTDSLGTTEWTQLFQIGQWSVPNNILQTKDEGFMVYGTAADTNFLNNNKHFLFLHKTGITGDRIWDKDYSLSDNDIAVNLIERKAGGYIASSIADYNISAYPKAVLTRFDENGIIIWSKRYYSTYGVLMSKAVEMHNGNICFAAYSGSFSSSPFNDIIVTMVDPDGNVIWTKNIGTYYDDEPTSIDADSSNNIYITGRTYIINREWDSFLLKLDNTGNIVLSKMYDAGTAQGEIMRCIIAHENGSCTLLGDIGAFDERDISMINVDANGSVMAEKRYTFSPMFTNYPYDFYKAHDGGFVFTGDVRLPSALRGAILVKTDSSGNVWCHNSAVSFSEHNEIFSDSAVALFTANSPLNTRNDSATVPINPFNSTTVCAMPTNIDDEINNNHFMKSVYPNPTNDFVSIEMDGVVNIEEIIISDIQGQKIKEISFEKNENKVYISLKLLAPGFYFIDLKTKGGSEKIKVLKL